MDTTRWTHTFTMGEHLLRWVNIYVGKRKQGRPDIFKVGSGIWWSRKVKTGNKIRYEN